MLLVLLTRDVSSTNNVRQLSSFTVDLICDSYGNGKWKSWCWKKSEFCQSVSSVSCFVCSLNFEVNNIFLKESSNNQIKLWWPNVRALNLCLYHRISGAEILKSAIQSLDLVTKTFYYLQPWWVYKVLGTVTKSTFKSFWLVPTPLNLS